MIVFLMSGSRGRAMVFSYQSIPLGACVVVLCFEGEVNFCNKYMSSFLTNASPWTYAHLSFYFASLYYFTQLSPVSNPLFTFLKTATIPTYYGISIAIPRYIAMQLSTVPFIMTHSIIVILLFCKIM